MQANRILEVGTGYGYSTLWMALAQPSVGRIWTIDPDAQRTEVARAYFHRAGRRRFYRSLQYAGARAARKLSASQSRHGVRRCGQSRSTSRTSISSFRCSSSRAWRSSTIAWRRPRLRATLSDASRLGRHDLPFGIGIGARRQMTSAQAFRRAMRRVPTGVTVVTTLKEGEPRGITVNAFASVSLDPPSLLICVNREARSYLFISSSRIFCVNVLAGDQRPLAEHYRGPYSHRSRSSGLCQSHRRRTYPGPSRFRSGPPGGPDQSQPGWLYEGNAVLHPRGSEYQTQFVVDGIPFTDNRSPSFGPEVEADDVQSMSIFTAGYPPNTDARWAASSS